MFKTHIENLKSAKAHARPLSLSLLLLASLCTFSPLVVHNAHAATNPAGQTVNSMETTINDSILENYGTILGGKLFTAAGTDRYAGMYGFSASNASYTFRNFKDITIIRPTTNNIFGMYARTEINGNHNLSNSGSITVSGNEGVYGMFAFSDGAGNHNLTNSGSINASGTADFVYGMYASSNGGNHTLTNSGSINVSRTANSVYGMYVRSNGAGNHTLTNSGTIDVSGDVEVYGMLAFTPANVGNHNLTNSGSIKVSGNRNVMGMYAFAADGNHNLTNSGTIDVSGNESVYGMYVGGTNVNNGIHLLNNTGVITAKATTGGAFEAYGHSDYSVGTWATTLRTWSATNVVFGGDAGVSVNLANSTLILRPGTAAQGFVLGKEYNVGKGVAGDYGMAAGVKGTVGGTIVAATTEVPFLKATLTNGANLATATVKLESNVSASTTPGAATMQQAVAQVQGQFNNLSTSLRNALVEIYTQANLVADNGTNGMSAGSGFSPKNKWQVFLNPYANTVNNSKLDYNGNNMGITAGASYRVNDNFSFGGHLDFSSANYYGELMDMSTKSTSFALGLHAAYNFTPECYLRGQLTGSVNQNDSYYTASPTLNADANYNGEAVYMELATGYTWQIARDNTSAHSLTPEIGLSYLGTHTGAYDIKWSGAGSMYDMNYADSYYNAFYGTLSLDWRSEWELENDASIALLAGLGLRQTLSNGEMETNFRTLGSKYSATSTEDLTTFLADVGVEYKKGNFSVSLNYDGGFGYAQTSHGGNVMVKLEF